MVALGILEYTIKMKLFALFGGKFYLGVLTVRDILDYVRDEIRHVLSTFGNEL